MTDQATLNAAVHALVPVAALLAMVGVLTVSGAKTITLIVRKDHEMRKRKVTQKRKFTQAQREQAERIRWNIQQEYLFRVERCVRCGVEPGVEHGPAHKKWAAELILLTTMYALPYKGESR